MKCNDNIINKTYYSLHDVSVQQLLIIIVENFLFKALQVDCKES